jgi:protein-S-isoprenylcysteine O-methyltransferase Ste14
MREIYRTFAYFGVVTVFGTLLYGYRYDPGAPAVNIAIDVGLFLVFAVPHLIMTRGWFKRAVWGSPTGSPTERRVYVTVGIVLWVGIFAFHLPVPGPSIALPEWVRFIGMLGFILAVLSFFQGVTFDMIDGLMGVPGSTMNYSHGSETPLHTDGPYAQVRHPMYRAALFAGMWSVVIHPNVGQVLWAAMIGATFVLFIPIEERQLIGARGDEYVKYREKTPYRLFHGVW